MKFLIVVAALFASATLTPAVVQGQYGGDAEAVPSDANNLNA
jgi:hypothetical protein